MGRDLPVRSSRISVGVVARPEPIVTGTSRFTARLLVEIASLGVETKLLQPGPAPFPGPVLRLGRRLGADIGAFFAHYPLRLPSDQGQEPDVYHLMTQNLATLLLFHHFRRPVVVTVHDIIPYLVRNDRRLKVYAHPLHGLFDYLAMQGLKRANLLMADSEWTKGTLVRALGVRAERIEVVHLGVDMARFRPLAVPNGFWRRFGLDAANRHVLYVGSEDPRKNLEDLLRAFAIVCRRQPDLQLVKVGAPRHLAEHRRLQNLALELGIGPKVHWIDQVSEDDLPLFYNAADLYVMPSLYEGFGLPVLEALACGTRVVCSDATSLPEVAGEDSLLCSQTVEGLTRAIVVALARKHEEAGREERRQWAHQFSWSRTAEMVCDVYRQVGRVSGRKQEDVDDGL